MVHKFSNLTSINDYIYISKRWICSCKDKCQGLAQQHISKEIWTAVKKTIVFLLNKKNVVNLQKR